MPLRFRTTACDIALCVWASAASGNLLAQCPDGSPPPCGRPAPVAARTPADENVVAIFPFRVTGSSADAVTLREGAMDLLQLALDEQAGWRAVPSRTLLPPRTIMAVSTILTI